MQIVQPGHRILRPNDGPLKHIELIGRTCYKSEDKITNESSTRFVRMLADRHHDAMLEHFRFIVEVDGDTYDTLFGNRYFAFTREGRPLISFSARAVNDLYNITGDSDVIDALCHLVSAVMHEYGDDVGYLFDHSLTVWTYNPNIRAIRDFFELATSEYRTHAWYSVLFTCDRGITHEIVRHRDTSLAQESTRYCNYARSDEISVIYPFAFNDNPAADIIWRNLVKYAEVSYMQLIALGIPPQWARSVLPQSTKADIVVTAQVYEWMHIFELRALGTTGTPHPQMVEIMNPAMNEFVKLDYLPDDFCREYGLRK